MSAVSLRVVWPKPERVAVSHRPPERNPSYPPGEYPGPVRLTPIAWGQPNPLMGQVICRHLVDANPPITLPFNPLKDRTIRKELRRLRIHH